MLVHQPESPLIKPEEEEDVSRQTKQGGSNNNILFPLLQVAETLLQSSGEETENNKEVMPVRGKQQHTAGAHHAHHRVYTRTLKDGRSRHDVTAKPRAEAFCQRHLILLLKHAVSQ